MTSRNLNNHTMCSCNQSQSASILQKILGVCILTVDHRIIVIKLLKNTSAKVILKNSCDFFSFKQLKNIYFFFLSHPHHYHLNILIAQHMKTIQFQISIIWMFAQIKILIISMMCGNSEILISCMYLVFSTLE